MPVLFQTLRGGRGAPVRLARSRGIVAAVEPVAERVLENARQDPNPTYSAAVYKRVDRRLESRARWIITLPPYLESLARRVEAKRATMKRAARV